MPAYGAHKIAQLESIIDRQREAIAAKDAAIAAL
jgi:hypothetical protein